MGAGPAPRPSRPPQPRRGQGWPSSPLVEGGPARTSAPDRRAAAGRVRTGSCLVRPRVLRLAPGAAPSRPTDSGPGGAAVRFARHGSGLRAPRCPRRCARYGSPWRRGAANASQDGQPLPGRWRGARRSSRHHSVPGHPSTRTRHSARRRVTLAHVGRTGWTFGLPRGKRSSRSGHADRSRRPHPPRLGHAGEPAADRGDPGGIRGVVLAVAAFRRGRRRPMGIANPRWGRRRA